MTVVRLSYNGLTLDQGITVSGVMDNTHSMKCCETEGL